MAASGSILIVKKFVYRDNLAEEWSNRYYFNGTVPADAAAWNTFFTSVATQEKTCYTSNCRIIRAYGYGADPTAAVWSKDLLYGGDTSIPGTLSAEASSERLPGDAAVVGTATTAALNTKGRPIFLRKYFHDARNHSPSAPDQVDANQLAAITTYMGKWCDGTSFGGPHLCSPRGENGLVGGCLPWVTTRTLKRRGRRPTTP